VVDRDATAGETPDIDEQQDDEGVRDSVRSPMFQNDNAQAELADTPRLFSSGDALFFSTMKYIWAAL